jgi:hypothetical protein
MKSLLNTNRSKWWLWCSGSTRACGALCLGSTPSSHPKMKKIFFFSIISFLIFAKQALAICPVCTIAVGAGVGLSRWLGIDDSVTGLWIGGLIVSVIMWTIDWLDKKGKHFKWRNVTVVLVYYIVTLVPLYFSGLILSRVRLAYFWHDKLVLGILAGSLIFWLGTGLYPRLKEKNGGRAHFPFQKVVMPIIPVIIMSVIFYLLTK